MAGFDKDAFWSKILSMYNEAKENNYILKLDEEQIRELKALYIDLYIPMENLGRVLNTYVISKFYRILYLSQSRLIFLSNFEIYLLYGDVRC